ncbi:MAG: YihY/virulence factor BrkB family protein [bacterium]|nr:YihY/virulence factor BrkB family protein [bacterium]
MKKLKLDKLGYLLKLTFKKWYDRDPFKESSVIAYNAIFSLPGLLVLVVSMTGYFFGVDAVNGRLHHQISIAMGSDTADQIQNMVIMAAKNKNSKLASILAIATILIGATGVFVQMQKSLNTIWTVEATVYKSGFWIFVKTRLFSFGLIISVAFLLLISLVLSSLLAAISLWAQQNWSESFLVLFQIINVVFTMVTITTLFAFMFKFLPDAQIKWHLVWVGAFLTAILFILGKSALGIYFGKVQPASGYGAAGSVILILLWTSYSSMIVFFGAEFTKVYADHYYGEIPASENAIKIKEK